MGQMTLPDAVQTYGACVQGADVEIVGREQPEALDLTRHDAVHLMAEAGFG